MLALELTQKELDLILKALAKLAPSEVDILPIVTIMNKIELATKNIEE